MRGPGAALPARSWAVSPWATRPRRGRETRHSTVPCTRQWPLPRHRHRWSSHAATARSYSRIILPMTNLLILGGTYQARECAETLLAQGFAVTSSLAGRVTAPRLPAGEVRIGGFGGPGGMTQWLTEHRIAAVVDATHPFAERIGSAAVTACNSAGIPLLRLQRPGWQPGPDDRWHWA